jgi:hypothetical protein
MSWLSIIIWVITNIPTIISDLEAILNLFHGSAHSGALLSGFKADMTTAIKSGDNDAVINVVNSAKLVGQGPMLVGNA